MVCSISCGGPQESFSTRNNYFNSHNFNWQDFYLSVSNPRSLLMFNSRCPLEVRISQVLGPFLQIELLKAGRTLTSLSNAQPLRRGIFVAATRSCQGFALSPRRPIHVVPSLRYRHGRVSRWLVVVSVLVLVSVSSSSVSVLLLTSSASVLV